MGEVLLSLLFVVALALGCFVQAKFVSFVDRVLAKHTWRFVAESVMGAILGVFLGIAVGAVRNSGSSYVLAVTGLVAFTWWLVIRKVITASPPSREI